jgi:hypothetical protein
VSLKDRFASTDSMRADGFSCSRYAPAVGGKRCRHYVAGGSCALPDELQCLEWLRANGHPLPGVEARTQLTPTTETATPPPTGIASMTPEPDEIVDDVERDLFGDPVGVPPPTRPTPKSVTERPDVVRDAATPTRFEDVPLVRNLSAEEVASFKALGVEVCLASEAIGEVWIVPDYTSKDRNELSVEHAATFAAVCSAFPGAKVVSFERRQK